MANTIGETFKDYISESNILNCEVKNINLYKKSKKLEIELETEKGIGIGELGDFEEYLKNKFDVSKVITNVKYKVKIKESSGEKTESSKKSEPSKKPVPITMEKIDSPVILRKNWEHKRQDNEDCRTRWRL